MNVARLLVGSEGTLGLFTAATLHTSPLPTCRGVELLQKDVVGIIESKLVEPALAWAAARFLSKGAKGGQAARIAEDVAQSLTGKVEKVTDVDHGAVLAMEGVLRRDASKLARAEGEIQQRLDAIAQLGGARIIDQVLERVETRVVLAAQSRATQTLDQGFRAIDERLSTIRGAGRKPLEAFPFVGKMLAGIADEEIADNQRRLVGKAVDYLSGPAALTMHGLLKQIATLAKGGKGVVPKALQGIAGMLRALDQDVRARLAEQRKAFTLLLGKVQAAKKRLLAAVPGTKGGR